MKIKTVIFLLSVLLILVNQRSFAQGDLFDRLRDLKIGDPIPADLVESKESLNHDGGIEIYAFASEQYSHPHLVYVENSAVIFVQLTLPYTLQEEYAAQVLSMGEPETTLPKTRSEIMLGYPSRGLAFVVDDYAKTVLRMQKFPVKTAQEFVRFEGRNFQPVPFVQPTVVATSSASPPLSQIRPPLNPAIISLLGAGTILILAILITIKFSKKRSF